MIDPTIWELIIKFNDKYFPGWKDREIIYYSNAIAGEAGEICGIAKKMCGGGTHFDKEEPNLLEECWDVLIYMVVMLQSQGYIYSDFEQAFFDKLEVLYKRMEERGG